MSAVSKAAIAVAAFNPPIHRVPLPQPKPPLLTLRLDNPINQRYMHVFEAVHTQHQGHPPWVARLHNAGVDEVRVKAADARAAFADPQKVAQSLFGPMIRIAGDADKGLKTHAQVPKTYVGDGQSLADVAQRYAERVAPYGTASLESAQRLLGALIEASVHPEVDAALRQLGQGPSMVSVASKELLDQALHERGTRGVFLGSTDPAVFLNANIAWLQAHASGTVLAPAGKTQALTAYLRASDPVHGALDFLLRGGIKPHETRLKAMSQRENLSTLAVVQQLLAGGVADYAQAWDVAARVYPEGAVQGRQPPKIKAKKPKADFRGDFAPL